MVYLTVWGIGDRISSLGVPVARELDPLYREAKQ
jgi:hypothetical protein